MNGGQAELPAAATQEAHAAPALVTTGEPAGPAEEPVVGAAPAADSEPPVQQQQQQEQPLQQPELDRNGQELFRLFVGALPQDYSEEELRPLFSKYGTLKGVSVLREPDGTSKSCGFVLYDNRESAERAIAALDRALTLPGQGQPIEVRFARKPALVQPGAGPQDNRQIFFSGGPPGVARKDVVQLFSYYGKVEHVHLFMDFRTKQSKGCGFVTFSTRKEAEDAMTALDQSYTMPGARMVLTVRWHDPDLQERKRRAAEGLAEDQRQLFVAKVLKSSPEEDVQQLFSHYGQVDKVTMFRPAPDAVYHKGCGVVTMARREDAEAALRALDEAYVWPGMTEPLVVKWMDSDLNKRRRFEPSMPGIVSLEPPPPGCDPDAVKLYAGNIPLSYSVDNIRQVFKQYGRVIQILVARDKETHQPKGSAYVWFQRRRESELALKRLNGSTTAMPDPANPHAKPLMVTLAQHSVAPVRKLGGPAGGAPLGPIGYMAGGQGGGQGGFGGGQGMAQPLQLPPSGPQFMPQQNFPAQQQQQHGGGYGGMAGAQQGFGMGGQQQYPSQQAQQGMGGYGVGASGAGENAYYDQGYGYGSNASQDPNAYYDGSAGYSAAGAAGPQAAGYGMPPGGPMQQPPQQQQQLPPQQAQQGYGSHGGGYASPAAQGPGIYGGAAGQAGQYGTVQGQYSAVQGQGQYGVVQGQGQYGAVQGQGQYGAGGATTTSTGGGYGGPSYNPPQGGYYPGNAASAGPSSAGGGSYGGPPGAYGGSGYQAGPGYGAPPAAPPCCAAGGMQEGPGVGPQQQYGGYAGHQAAAVGQYGYGQ